MAENKKHLFDRLSWVDPISGRMLEPIILSRTPAGLPINGAMRVEGTSTGYPIVDCVVRLTPELANRYKDWLSEFCLSPPKLKDGELFQPTSTVDSFGWQWTWNSSMRSDKDLESRVINKFGINKDDFNGNLIIDIGAGAGDQSSYMLKLGSSVVSVDLSSAIEVVAHKLREKKEWVGVQADVMTLPFAKNQFDLIYCEGVIQHTKDSKATVQELCRAVRIGGMIMAAHYIIRPPKSIYQKIKRSITSPYYHFLRSRLSKLDRFSLLLFTGVVSALSYLPFFGFFLRRSGTVMYYDLMPDFKSTWTNTFDYYGNHSFQRIITEEEFESYFDISGIKILKSNAGNILAIKNQEL